MIAIARNDDGARAPDYSHRFHAGNVGDVWKHCVLVEVLRLVAASGRPVRFVDTHAGEGAYPLATTGEWTEGIGRVWDVRDATAVARYVDACRRLGAGSERPERYPGSPHFAADVLGGDARLDLWEIDPGTGARLETETAGDPRVRVHHGDGLAALRAPSDGATLVLIDPPYTAKADWQTVPAALATAVRAAPHAAFLLWYPVKSLTRPNAMLARLEADGVPATIAELVTTPLELQRNRLNGSGMLFVRPPDGTLAAVAAMAPIIGARCATQRGAWSFRMRALGSPP